MTELVKPNATTLAGQTLLNAELARGLAAKDSELHAERMAAIHGGSRAADKGRASRAAQDVNALREQIVSMQAALKERDDILLNWMHTNEAFKQLARRYASALGKSDAERQAEMDNIVVDLAEENPQFKATKALAIATARLAGES